MTSTINEIDYFLIFFIVVLALIIMFMTVKEPFINGKLSELQTLTVPFFKKDNDDLKKDIEQIIDKKFTENFAKIKRQ